MEFSLKDSSSAGGSNADTKTDHKRDVASEEVLCQYGEVFKDELGNAEKI